MRGGDDPNLLQELHCHQSWSGSNYLSFVVEDSNCQRTPGLHSLCIRMPFVVCDVRPCTALALHGTKHLSQLGAWVWVWGWSRRLVAHSFVHCGHDGLVCMSDHYVEQMSARQEHPCACSQSKWEASDICQHSCIQLRCSEAGYVTASSTHAQCSPPEFNQHVILSTHLPQ